MQRASDGSGRAIDRSRCQHRRDLVRADIRGGIDHAINVKYRDLLVVDHNNLPTFAIFWKFLNGASEREFHRRVHFAAQFHSGRFEGFIVDLVYHLIKEQSQKLANPRSELLHPECR